MIQVLREYFSGRVDIFCLSVVHIFVAFILSPTAATVPLYARFSALGSGG